MNTPDTDTIIAMRPMDSNVFLRMSVPLPLMFALLSGAISGSIIEHV